MCIPSFHAAEIEYPHKKELRKGLLGLPWSCRRVELTVTERPGNSQEGMEAEAGSWLITFQLHSGNREKIGSVPGYKTPKVFLK